MLFLYISSQNSKTTQIKHMTQEQWVWWLQLALLVLHCWGLCGHMQTWTFIYQPWRSGLRFEFLCCLTTSGLSYDIRCQTRQLYLHQRCLTVGTIQRNGLLQPRWKTNIAKVLPSLHNKHIYVQRSEVITTSFLSVTSVIIHSILWPKLGLGLCCSVTPGLSKDIRCHVRPYFF